MKLSSIIASTILTLAAGSVMAEGFIPPYHVDDAYIGKATIQSSGSCKIKKTYENAQEGIILDSEDNTVGYGILSADGELLALQPGYTFISSDVDDTNQKGTQVWFDDLGSDDTAATIASLGSCTVDRLITSAKTKGTYAWDYKKGKRTYTQVYPFNGVSPALESTKGTRIIKKAQTFSGSIVFKGSRPVPI